jgi:hypothetical protein
MCPYYLDGDLAVRDLPRPLHKQARMRMIASGPVIPVRTCLNRIVRPGWSRAKQGKDARVKTWRYQVEPEDAALRRQSAALGVRAWQR